MNASWVSAIVAIAIMLGTFTGVLWRGGRRDGKIDAILEELTRRSNDHEDRLRVVEHWTPQHRRNR